MAATALLVSTLTAALLIVGVALLLAHANDAAVRSRLDARVSAGAATVVDGPHGVHVLEQRSRLLDQDVWIFDREGRLIDGRLPAATLSKTVTELGTGSVGRSKTVDDVSFLARPVRRHGEWVATVVAAEDHDPYERAERSSVWLTIGLGVATVVIATGAAWMAATRSLNQVQAMADLADDWGEHDVGRRFDPGPGGDEIAHELRTPLAVVLAEADLARQHATPDQSEGLDNIRAAGLRMRDSIDTLLSAARAHAAGGERATVGELMAALELPSTAYDGLVLSAPVSPMVAALRPLLENAERHGSGEPRVDVTRDGRTVVIAVLDDGPGVAPEDLERVFEPGHTTEARGSGLGLPLARRMVRAVGGDVLARPGPGGRFEVRVPGR